MSLQQPFRPAVILTAIPVETRCVLSHLGDIGQETVRGTVFMVGTFAGHWRVAVAELGAGNMAAAALAERALAHFEPEVALFVGVAGGIKDIGIGDVVAATKVYGFESGKIQDGDFLPRPDVARSSHRLEQQARAVARSGAWRARRKGAVERDSRAIVAPIAAGEKVVASVRHPLYDFLRRTYGDAVAVEMEGRGFLEAVHLNEGLGLVVRGISDLLEGKAAVDAGGSQEAAAAAAAAFAFELLIGLDSGPKSLIYPPIPDLLMLPQGSWQPDRSPPGALLRADFGVIPFHGRETEMADLDAWCGSEAAVALRLYTGAGGMGKTRLMIEACQRLRARNWLAGFVDLRRGPAEAEPWRVLMASGKLVLVVLDYAENQPHRTRAVLEAAAATRVGRVRVVLLARAAEDWWQMLKGQPDEAGGLAAGRAARWLQLAPLALTVGERQTSYERAARRFAEVLERPQAPVEPPDFGDRLYERVLMLHIHALASVEGMAVQGEDGVLDFLLNREQRFWRDRAAGAGLGLPMADAIAQAMVAATLAGGFATAAEATDMLMGLTLLAGQPAVVVNAVAKLLHDIYPGDKWIEPLQPDLLGEHLIERVLGDDDTTRDRIFDLIFGHGA